MRNEIDFRRLIISAALIGALVFVVSAVVGENDIGGPIEGPIQKIPSIASSPPEFEFTYEQVCCFNMSFCGWASDPANITNHTWDFGDGWIMTLEGAPGMVTHQYTSCGTKLVKLSGYDNEGAFNMTTKAVYVPCPPTAIVGSVPYCYELNGTFFTFDGSASYADTTLDPSSHIISYRGCPTISRNQ
jgi:hypothetical protein